MIGGTTLDFDSIVRTATARQKPQTIEDSELVRKGIGNPLGKPADGSGADAG
jgi:hypothetical protein